MHKDIPAYHADQSGKQREMCDLLRAEIDKALPNAESKIWHAHPVTFIEGNPIVGYHVMKKGDVRLLFWSGQSFEEPGLKNEGSFKAAEVRYNEVSEINTEDIARWLAKAEVIQWDYKNIVKRRGKLVRI